jgi:DNA-binding PadR family transcriptional regulator
MRYQGDQDLETRTIKNFVDILILKYLREHPLVSCYEILRYLQDTLNIPFSPGTVYHMVSLLERRAFVKGDGDERGRTYELTTKGEKRLNFACKSKNQIQTLISNILSEA